MVAFALVKYADSHVAVSVVLPLNFSSPPSATATPVPRGLYDICWHIVPTCHSQRYTRFVGTVEDILFTQQNAVHVLCSGL